MNTLITLFFCGLIGLVFSDIRKIISLRRKGNIINYKFTISDYWRMDWDIIFSQFLSIIIGLICWKYTAGKSWAQYGELIFAGWGAVGTELLNTFFSRAEKDLINRIKEFTTKADDGFVAGESLPPGGPGGPPPGGGS